MPSRNGDGGRIEKQRQIQQERDERQLRNSTHQQNIQQAQTRNANQFESEKAQYLEKLMRTDMSDAGINLLDNMLDRSFILGNISEAEYHDVKWEMHAMYLKIRSNFPQQDGEIVGEARAFILDDRDEHLEPLTGQQRTIIAQMIRGVTILVSRSKEGFQQEMNVKSINVSEIMDPEEEEDDGLKLGLFGR